MSKNAAKRWQPKFDGRHRHETQIDNPIGSVMRLRGKSERSLDSEFAAFGKTSRSPSNMGGESWDSAVSNLLATRADRIFISTNPRQSRPFPAEFGVRTSKEIPFVVAEEDSSDIFQLIMDMNGCKVEIQFKALYAAEPMFSISGSF